ncbi:LamB/YcsF family protein [Bacillus cereus]
MYKRLFADRTYKQDGTLTSRTEENALIKDEDEAIKQVLQMVKKGHVKCGQWRESSSSGANNLFTR